MTDERRERVRARASFCIVRAIRVYQRIFGPPSPPLRYATYSSRRRDCFSVLISKMVNALETATKNEKRSLVAF